MTSLEKLELRASFIFCQQLGDTPSATFKKIKEAKGENSASRALEFSWHKRFGEGEGRIENMKRECARTKITTSLTTLIERSLQEDRRLTLRALAEKDRYLEIYKSYQQKLDALSVSMKAPGTEPSISSGYIATICVPSVIVLF